MSTRRNLLGLLVAAPLVFATAAQAGEMTYTSTAFETAAKAGKPILVHITAPWCTTCKAQKRILSKLEADAKFKNLQVFDIDFDSRKDLVKRFKATMQSTLITYKGGTETGRLAGESDPDAIAALLDKAI